MSTRIEMPELSSDGEGATLATWLVSVGDRVQKGDVIAELETDKSTLELEAPATGTIAGFEVEEGVEGIQPGTLLALLDAEEVGSAEISEISENSDSADATEAETTADSGESDHVPATTPATAKAAGGVEDEAQVLRSSTPLARRAARARKIDLATVEGSGPGGRIVEEDVLRSVEDPGAPMESGGSTSGASVQESSATFETRPLGPMRRTIAQRMSEAKRQVPHFYLRRRCSMDAVLDARATLNAEMADTGVEISVNDFVLLAAARALRDVPEANVSFREAGSDGEPEPALHVFDRVDVCVAVATDDGLVTPVVREADRKGLSWLAREVEELAALAREGGLRPEQVEGGSFTISNLGMYGVETVYPILNPPQACILGVGAVREEPVVREGEVGIGRIAEFTLAADHRAIDGAVGARLLSALCERLEDPLSMLL